MSRICQLTEKKPLKGHHVSHSNRKTNRHFYPNLQTKRIFVPEVGMWITVKIASSELRTIDKLGAYQYFKRQLAKGFDPKIWAEDPKEDKTQAKRGYRRVEQVDKAGQKSYSITYEPEKTLLQSRRVKLSSVVK